jgi:hypothetical protein
MPNLGRDPVQLENTITLNVQKKAAILGWHEPNCPLLTAKRKKLRH